MLKVLLVDDHTIVREGLKQILSETTDMVVAGEAANGIEALQEFSNQSYDLVILDISMPGRGGLEVLKELKYMKPHIPVLMLSMFPEEQYAVRALKGGASGYLTKDSAAVELIAAIRKVTKGGKYISSQLAETLACHLDQDSQTVSHELLSDREYQVMLMIAAGKTVSEIADELNLSVKTISTHRSRALQKMAMKNNAEFTYYAIKEGLVN